MEFYVPTFDMSLYDVSFAWFSFDDAVERWRQIKRLAFSTAEASNDQQEQRAGRYLWRNEILIRSLANGGAI